MATLDVTDIKEGTVYDVWILIYAGTDLGDLGDMTVFVDYARDGDSAFNGTFKISGVFDSSMADSDSVLMTMERMADKVILKDRNGKVIAKG